MSTPRNSMTSNRRRRCVKIPGLRLPSPTKSRTFKAFNRNGEFLTIEADSLENINPEGLDKFIVVGDDVIRGGYGSVYKGLDLGNGEYVAIKVVSLRGTDLDPNHVKQELDLLKSLNHKNVVKYLGSCTTVNNLFIIFEYMENGSLADIVKPNKLGPFPEESLVAVYIAQVLEGLVYLHQQGVIHRSIKAANILTTKEGLAKLSDFGIVAKLTEANSKLYWSAPEDEHPPFPDGLSSELANFLQECFKKDAKLRPDAKTLLSHPWIKNCAYAQQPSIRHTGTVVDAGSGHGSEARLSSSPSHDPPQP